MCRKYGGTGSRIRNIKNLIKVVFCRATLNKTCEERADKDGLIDVQYRMVGKESYKTYTKIFIDLRLIDIQKITMYIDGKPSVDIDLHIGNCILKT